MKKSLCIKGIALLFSAATQFCSPAFGHAARLLPAAFPQPVIKSGFSHHDLLDVNHTAPLPVRLITTESTARANPLAEKLSKTLYALAHIDLRNGTAKDPRETDSRCAVHVRKAFESIGIKFTGGTATGQLAENLKKAKFRIIDPSKEKLLAGDIGLVISPPELNKFGHTTTLTTNGQWVSSTIQGKKANPWSKPLPVVYYRSEKLAPIKIAGNSGNWHFASSDYLTQSGRDNLFNQSIAYGFTNYVSKKHYDLKLYREGMEEFFAQIVRNSEITVPSPRISVELPEETLTANARTGKKANITKIATASAVVTAALLPSLLKQRPLKTADGQLPSPRTSSTNTCSILTERKPDQEKLQTLRDQWKQARKAVLRLNKSLNNEWRDVEAHETLKKSVLAMGRNLYGSMDINPIEAFKAARYVYNKINDRSLFASNEKTAQQKDVLLRFISANLDRIAKTDPELGQQAARFVMNKSGKGPLRNQMASRLTSLPKLSA
jgi:hypothetical protein